MHGLIEKHYKWLNGTESRQISTGGPSYLCTVKPLNGYLKIKEGKRKELSKREQNTPPHSPEWFLSIQLDPPFWNWLGGGQVGGQTVTMLTAEPADVLLTEQTNSINNNVNIISLNTTHKLVNTGVQFKKETENIKA